MILYKRENNIVIVRVFLWCSVQNIMRIARFYIRRTLSITPIFCKMAIQSSGMLAGRPGGAFPLWRILEGAKSLTRAGKPTPNGTWTFIRFWWTINSCSLYSFVQMANSLKVLMVLDRDIWRLWATVRKNLLAFHLAAKNYCRARMRLLILLSNV